ncbi:hypothetical protein VNO77_25233 [Canavalia gladiata]|uniref:Uncharacterized protein n=1 Tax=Canavalia gladiata TaxID=3824 RepID=A0AAN9QDE8_CANGL
MAVYLCVVTDAASLPMKTYEVETAEDIMASFGEPQPCGSTSPSVTVPGTGNNSINDILDPHDKLLDGSGAGDASEPSRSAPCTEDILLLLEQAVERRSVLVLDDESLDDDHIYQTSVVFAKSAPSEPRKVTSKKLPVSQ